MIKSNIAAALCIVAIALVAASANLQASSSPAIVESAAWSKFVNDYVEATFKAQPFFAVYAGRHEFDGRMPDLSKAGIDAEVTRLRAARVAALAIEHGLTLCSADGDFARFPELKWLNPLAE